MDMLDFILKQYPSYYQTMWSLIPLTTPNTGIICPSQSEKKRMETPPIILKKHSKTQKISCNN